ncbi:hypothetical protein [Candidatus Hecatella orcuttiae]|jgi:hypothetical protein|uniref:hypothetical protein n=1 Tax=Candidatus Hecatella orcuttiae TaxID=1935119 RepID=UPI0028681F0D|nr:hypothetical protein [Candidatus Hecatella orcuttiae]
MINPAAVITLATFDSVAAWYAGSKLVGHVLIFVILMLPIYALLVAAAVGRPRMMKLTGFFYGFVASTLLLLVASVFILSGILSLIVP